ncbi:hypothetical protein [Tsukamurella sp. PLM1]|uniref:hypothetical protein n=1 Tax=Tsukamurella sp. PLM1 TaxID=2929795 RepID=UPI0020524285|nr:hypothetical protein [Tsukamurella sp. PLM1]BDH59314.1 hypothetical protein MTP03_42530 [Tsukamurella sp. PLM1]
MDSPGFAAAATAVVVAGSATALGTAGTACACSCAPPRAMPNPVVIEGTVRSGREVPRAVDRWADGLVYTIAVTRVYGDTGARAPRTVTVGVPARLGASCGLNYRDGAKVRLLVNKSRTGVAQWSTDLCTNLGISKVDLARLPVSVPA